MTKVGLPIAVANAHEVVKQKSCLITDSKGGNGAAREVCDFLLKAQNKFDQAMSVYLK